MAHKAPVMGAAADGELYYRAIALSDQTGGMAALRPETGERVWYATHREADELLRPRGGMVQLGTVRGGDGHSRRRVRRARGTARCARIRRSDGEVLWEYNTMQEYETVNGVRAKGGSIGGHGPAIVGGMLFMGSGYNIISSSPGNVLLAFDVE